ncbi:hypothetical protein HDR59_04040 [bacterium]|nr:hypothetical protein [bacterium]
MKNSLNKRIFLNILFLMGVFTAADIYAARPNAKRASRSKSSTPTKKKTSLSSSSETTTIIESSEDRSASGTVTARPGRTNTVSATSSSAVDDDTAAELLASNLLACLQSPCYGDVPYEKCFSNGAAESYTRANTTCLGMYNGAANDVVKVKAMNQVNTKIKSYFADSCSSAGGRISGNTCKIKVCYQAKGGSHHSPTKCMEYNVGKQVTCSATAFGLSQQDLEYKEDMTSEQLGTIVQAGMQTLSGLLETGVAVVDAVQASKKLKSGSDVKGKDCWGVYTYGSESITDIHCKEEWKKCKDGKKKGCTCEDGTTTTKTDSAGNYYCVTPTYEEKPSATTTTTMNTDMRTLMSGEEPSIGDKGISVSLLMNPSYGADLPSSGITITSKYCKSLNEASFKSARSCYVELPEWTEVAVQEQEASLYKKFTNFKKLQLQEKLDTMKQGAIYAGLQKEASQFGQSTYVQCSTSVGYRQYWDDNTKTSKYKACSQLALEYNKDNPNNKVNPSQCVDYQGECLCKNEGDACKDAVKQKDGYYKEQEFDYDDGVKKLENKIDNLSYAMIGKNEDKLTLSSATETFNSMQKKVNEKKQEITSLQEKKNTGIQKAISSGAQTLTTAGSTMTMAIVNANNNIGTMTGSCYIGDPAQGGVYLMSDNEVKKLTWKNL